MCFITLKTPKKKLLMASLFKNKLLLGRAGGRKEILNMIDNLVLSDSEISLPIHTDADSTAQGLLNRALQWLTLMLWESLTMNAQLQGWKYSAIILLKDYSIKKENENKNSFVRTLHNCSTTGKSGHQQHKRKGSLENLNSPPASYRAIGNRHPYLNKVQLVTRKQEENC